MTTKHPVISIDRPIALRDTPLHIRALGFGPGQSVTFKATMIDGLGQRLRSWASFDSDENGKVDLSVQAPTDGSYDAISAMGLFWSLEPEPDNSSTVPPPDLLRDGLTVELTAFDDANGDRAQTQVRRLFATEGVSHRRIRDGGIAGDLCLPPGAGPHPAIVLLSGSGGGNNPLLAAILASRGYATFALGYHNMEGVPEFEDTIPLEYFERAFAWLRSQDTVSEEFLAVMGRSRGGELSLLLGATFPEISAVVAYAGSGVIYGGYERRGNTIDIVDAVWSHKGRDFIGLLSDNRCYDESTVDWNTSPVATTPRYLSGLDDRAAVERSAIPVEKIKGPVLMISGTDD